MRHVVLTPRQLEVARLLADGRTQVEIADLLEISLRTVWHHTAEIRKKAGSATTASAVSRVRARALGSRSADL